MGRTIAHITVSLDGFVNDAHGRVEPLYPDAGEMLATTYLQYAIKNTGAVVMGRRTFSMADDPDRYADNYEYQAPIFVLTHTPPPRHPREAGRLTFTFVTDGLASAIRRARATAGVRDVRIVGGASVIRQCLAAGLCDELHLDLVPVLLGSGQRLFDGVAGDSVRLTKTGVIDRTAQRTTLIFEVERP